MIFLLRERISFEKYRGQSFTQSLFEPKYKKSILKFFYARVKLLNNKKKVISKGNSSIAALSNLPKRKPNSSLFLKFSNSNWPPTFCHCPSIKQQKLNKETICHIDIMLFWWKALFLYPIRIDHSNISNMKENSIWVKFVFYFKKILKILPCVFITQLIF